MGTYFADTIFNALNEQLVGELIGAVQAERDSASKFCVEVFKARHYKDPSSIY